MMTKENDAQSSLLEKVVVEGDLAALTAKERLSYYRAVCESIGVNPLTRPFDYIKLNGKLTLYARRDCTDQLRRIHGISTTIVSRDLTGDIYVVTARATDREARCDESTGAVSVQGLRGDALANALMKAETKAKRRVTLSLIGLGWLDETEIETVPSAAVVPVDDQGQIEAPRATEPKQTAPQPTTESNGVSIFGTEKQPNNDMLARFWAQAARRFRQAAETITDAEIKAEAHKALGVTSVYDWHGPNIGIAFAALDVHASHIGEK